MAALLACGAAAAAAQEGGALSLGGSLSARPFASYSGGADPAAGAFSYGSAASLGLDLRARGPGARAEASLEAAVLAGAAAGAAWRAAALGLAPRDSLILPYPAEGAADAGEAPETLLAARVRTLYAKLDLGPGALSLGRQVISYGRAAYWSPVDIFAELDASGLSPVKKGIDALRFRAGLGETGMMDLVAAPRSEPEEGSYGLRASGMVAGMDAGILFARIGPLAATAARAAMPGSWALGADFKADLGASFCGELLYAMPDAESKPEGVLRAGAGLDWSIGKLVLAAEYYYDGDPDAGAGSHNAYAALSWAASDFLRLSAASTWDIAGDRGGCTLILAWDAAQGAALSLYARASRTGRDPGPYAADAGLSLELKF